MPGVSASFLSVSVHIMRLFVSAEVGRLSESLGAARKLALVRLVTRVDA